MTGYGAGWPPHRNPIFTPSVSEGTSGQGAGSLTGNILTPIVSEGTFRSGSGSLTLAVRKCPVGLAPPGGPAASALNESENLSLESRGISRSGGGRELQGERRAPSRPW